MDSLNKYRCLIDYIDKELIKLFEQRMETAQKIGYYKKQRGLAVYHKDREDQIIERCITHLDNDEFQDETKEFLRNIMRISVEYQNRLIEEI